MNLNARATQTRKLRHCMLGPPLDLPADFFMAPQQLIIARAEAILA